MRTLKEIRDRVKTDTRETQLTDVMMNDFINLVQQEINDPGWAFEQKGARGFNHLWSFNRRKTTISTVADTEFYQLPRDLDKISLIRQTASPVKLRYLPDEIFYRYLPNPTGTGNPLYYRLWEEEGVAVRLSADDTVEILSSSSADTTQTIRLVGKDSNGLPQTESISLNGTTAVTGTITWNADDVLRVSKSADTTGTITVRKATGDTTLVQLTPTERTARFKIIGFYPIPGSAITISLEYFTRIRRLEGDNDVPDIDEKWLWIVRLGTMAKVYQYQPKETLFNTTQAMYAAGVRNMVKSDLQLPDYIPMLVSHNKDFYMGHLSLSDSVGSGFYGEGFGITF